MNIPDELIRNPHFNRYYRTWQTNQSSVVFIPLAQICREQGFLEQALDICEKGLQRHPNSVSGRIMLAKIFYDQEKSAKSLHVIHQILEEFPGQQEALSLLARLQRSQKNSNPPEDDEEVTEVSNNTSVPKGKNVSLWENVTMAKIYADQGEIRIAKQMLERILQRNPNDSRAKSLREAL